MARGRERFEDRHDRVGGGHGLDLGLLGASGIRELAVVDQTTDALAHGERRELRRHETKTDTDLVDPACVHELIGTLRDREDRQTSLERAKQGARAGVRNQEVAVGEEL